MPGVGSRHVTTCGSHGRGGRSPALCHARSVCCAASLQATPLRAGLIEGLRGLSRVLRRRRVVPLHVESKLRMLDRRSTRQEETNR